MMDYCVVISNRYRDYSTKPYIYEFPFFNEAQFLNKWGEGTNSKNEILFFNIKLKELREIEHRLLPYLENLYLT